MFRWIIGNSLRFRFILIALSAVMCYVGYDRLQQMPVDVFPEFAPPIVEIQTIAVGMSPGEVEELVTIPLEEALSGLPGLDDMRSKSVPDLSAIKLYFDRDVDLMHARQLVQERVDLVTPSLPTWAAPPFMLQPLSATSRVMKIGISSDQLSVIDLSMISYWKIRARLLRVPGVANVAIWGERLRMMQVQVDPERLFANGITLQNVMETTANALDVGLLQFSAGATIGTGGFLETPNQRLSIQHISPIPTVDQLAEVTLKIDEADNPVRLTDIANVVEDHQPMIGDGVINDGVGLLLIVEKFPWANTLDVTNGVEEAIDILRPGLPGMEIDTTIFRPANFIETSIHNLGSALIWGAVLVVLVLGAFLYEWRAALISVVAIPLSLVAAGLVIYFSGQTMNTMILAGLVIALGAVVDDAIIDVENIVRRLREDRKEGGTRTLPSLILEASIEIRTPIVFATLIIVAAIAPVFFLDGLSGSFFKPLALAYVLALAASLVVALTVTPALSLILFKNVDIGERPSPLARFLQHHYSKALESIIRRPRNALIVAGAIGVIGLAAFPLLGQQLLPSFKERDFLMHWVTTPGTSHPEMNRITIAASKELRAIPGVRNFGAHIGQAYLMDEVVGVNFGENWISIDPSVPYEETIAKLQEVVDGYPGLYRDLLTYLKERIREVLSGAGEAVVIRLYGPDLEVLRTKAQEVREVMEAIEGTVDVHVSLQTEIPQIQVEVDLVRAGAVGLKPGDVRRAVSYLVAGQEVGDVFKNGETYDVQVWTIPEARQSLSDIQGLLLDTPNGGIVQLKDVADVRITPTPNVIQREFASRYINIEANVEGRDLAAVANDVLAAVRAIDFPLGYRPELLGEFRELRAASDRLFLAEIVALVAILVLLQISFGSWRLTALAFCGLPIAFAGGVFAAFTIGGIISLGSLVGFLTVMGIAARNGILLLSHYQHLQRNEGMSFGPELVLRGALERLMPILMTAICTGIALVPLIVAGEIPGHEIEFPMAVVILGGIVSSTLVNLFVMPSMYAAFGRPEVFGSESSPTAETGVRPVTVPVAN